MADHPLTTMVGQFYNGLNEKCDFKTNLNRHDLPPTVQEVLDQLSDETMKRYYGSGVIIPENIKGCRILDIGCGSGSLVFALSKLVGPSGYVVGMDICPGLIETCKKESAGVAKKWGYDKPNFEFLEANVERLNEYNLGQFDCIVSNGVFCLVPDKDKALANVFNHLKDGGQFFLNDVYAQQEVDENLKTNETLWCLGTTGSMVWSQLKDFAVKAGFTCPYLFSPVGLVDIQNKEYKQMLKNGEYACASWRLFKLPAGAKRGAATVKYLGNIEHYPASFPWDVDLTFKKGEAVNVDAELATILANTPFKNNMEMVDCTAAVTTKRNQDPFAKLAELNAQNQARDFVYKVE